MLYGPRSTYHLLTTQAHTPSPKIDVWPQKIEFWARKLCTITKMVAKGGSCTGVSLHSIAINKVCWGLRTWRRLSSSLLPARTKPTKLKIYQDLKSYNKPQFSFNSRRLLAWGNAYKERTFTVFENHRKSLILAGDQTVLPDRSILKERKLAEKAQLKGDIFL